MLRFGKKRGSTSQTSVKATYDMVERSSAKPQFTERQINLRAMENGEAILTCMRLAWMDMCGAFKNDEIAKIEKKNAKNESANVMVDDVLYRKESDFVCLQTDGILSDSETHAVTLLEWGEMTKREKQDYPYPVVRFHVKGTDIDTTYDGALEGEEGDKAIAFAETFWRLANQFTSYRDLAGAKECTMDWEAHLPQNNKMGDIRLGYSEKGPYLVLGYEATEKALSKLSKKKRRKFLDAAQAMLEAALADITGLVRAECGIQGPTDDVEEETTLYFLLERAKKWKNESSRNTLINSVKKMRDEDKLSDDEIIAAFKKAKAYTGIIAEIEQALEKGEDPLKKPKQDTTDPKSKQKDKKTEKQTRPEPKETGDEGLNKSPYKADAYHRTPSEWATYFYMENEFGKAVAKGFFNDLKVDGAGNVPKVSIFEIAAYYQSKGVAIPAFIDKEIKAEIRRIEDKRAAMGS